MKRAWMPIVAPIALALILLAGWALTTTPGAIPSYVVPTPLAVVKKLIGGLVTYADMWSFIGTTLVESLAGCAVGILIGIPFAVVIYRSRLVSAAVVPFLGATQAIPAVAIAPVLVLWMASGFWRIVALCAIMVFFPILVSSLVGLRHVDRDVLSAALVDGAGSWARLIHIEIPLALPNILAGVRNGFTLSITGAVVGEMVMGGEGLGSLLMIQRNANDTAGMFATIIALAVLAAGVYSLVALVEKRWASSMEIIKETRS
ncbi:MAG: ABC transporter permease [Propionibacteriaceae bacterium]|jgi:NitT/TauT family transport system permease protein|nr:ABC transporter permease [Propionibacteriaceae bacterium]